MIAITRATTEADVTRSFGLYGAGQAQLGASIGFFNLQGGKT